MLLSVCHRSLGRVAILLLGSHTFRYLAIALLAIAVVLQTGATSSVKAIKMSAKLAVGKDPSEAEAASNSRPLERCSQMRLGKSRDCGR